ncbi:MAG: hypothetical protein KGH69_02265 [Candidatus Micrarchaeota archaeon]|nr:hypothetical protein [Candidatus Micrarchaeota archaeon]
MGFGQRTGPQYPPKEACRERYPDGYCERIEFYRRSTTAEIGSRLKKQIKDGSGLGLTEWGEKKLEEATRDKIVKAAVALSAEFADAGERQHAEEADSIASRLRARGNGGNGIVAAVEERILAFRSISR